MTRSKPWTLEEQAQAVALYFRMRQAVDTGRQYNKAQMIRAAQGIGRGNLEPAPGIEYPLQNRSRGSIEAKLMNVTAVLHDLGRHDVSMAEHGYRPLSNYQAELKTTVVGLLAVRDEAVAGGFEAIA
jgi:hypothetical protein